MLLAAARGCQRIELYTAFDQDNRRCVAQQFRELVRRRGEGEPVAYLVGQREFFSLRFRVTPDVLIPRPETELLVVRLLDLAKQEFAENRGVANRRRRHRQRHHCHLRGKAFAAGQSDGDRSQSGSIGRGARECRSSMVWPSGSNSSKAIYFRPLAAEHKFNIVASNPPYVSEAEFATLAPSVRNFEPHLALVAGPRGTEVIERLVPQAADRLLTGGWLLLEVSPMIEPAVREIVSASKVFELGPTLKDSAGQPRVVQAKRRA